MNSTKPFAAFLLGVAVSALIFFLSSQIVESMCQIENDVADCQQVYIPVIRE